MVSIETTEFANELAATADALDQLDAIYSLEIQKHKLLIQQLGPAGNTASAATASREVPPPDFRIHSRRAA